MTAIRCLLAQRHGAVLLCAAALLLRLIVPTGYMIGDVGGHMAITLCPGTAAPPAQAAPPAPPMTHGHGHGMTAATAPAHGSHDHRGREHGADLPCAFSGLSTAGLAAADPVLLAAFIAFVMATGLVAPALSRPTAPLHLRPPLRGPPAQR